MRKGPPSCHTFHAVRLRRFAWNCCYGYAAKQCREHGALNGRDVRNAKEPRNDFPRTHGNHDRKRWALKSTICMELAENQVGNVPSHPPKAARKPDVLHPAPRLALHQRKRPKSSLPARRPGAICPSQRAPGTPCHVPSPWKSAAAFLPACQPRGL